jgi:NAD+ diphosphatase
VPLNRVHHLRDDAAWLDERLADPATRFVAVTKSRNLILNGGEPRAYFHGRDTIADLVSARTTVALLGMGEGQAVEAAHFAIDLSHVPEEELLARSPAGALMDLRQLVQVIPSAEAAMLAYARGLLYWHERHRFCGACGSPTVSRSAGHLRACTNDQCGASHFPRTDSAVIMLVHDGDRCIMSRQSHWPPGMHSTLAGFLEPGESLEEAVAREVHEETGIRVSDVRYHSSQPWPFPSSIMVGFYARVTGGEFRPNLAELESAAWYTRDQLKTIGNSDRFRLPNAYSIARRLIEDWLEERFPT